MYKNPLPTDLQLGHALKFWRTFDHLSKAEVSRRIGIHRPNYTRWELAQSSAKLQQFVRLAKGLNVSPYILALTMEAFA